MMSLLEAIFLGFIQGLTEFLPVSSSGHLVILEHWLELPVTEFLFFDILLHIATLIAVSLFFYKQIFSLIQSAWQWLTGARNHQVKSDLLLISAIIVSTIITGIIGVTLKKTGVMDYMREDSWAVGVCFLITGVLLLSTSFIRSRNTIAPGYWPMNVWLFAIIIGLAQSFAILPGISRSGTTVCLALLLGASKERAVEYSFLISIPAIIGAMLIEFSDASINISLPIALAGFTTSLIFGFIFLWLLVWIVKVGKLHHFAYYVIPLGFWVIWTSL